MLLHALAAGLMALTVVLAGPVTVALARAQWPHRDPRAALVLWQAVGLGGGLGVLTAGLTLAAADLEPHWLGGIVAVPRRWRELTGWGLLGIGITLAVGLYLVSATASSTWRVLTARRAHRQRLALLSRALPRPEEGAPIRVLDHPHAVAYGVPGLRPQVVLTRGALETLTPAELAAVLAHEQAHARGRHDLVVQPFAAWHHTFPFLSPARQATVAVGLLVEMVADDEALRRCSAADLASALGKLSAHHLDQTLGDQKDLRRQLDQRITRLRGDRRRSLPWFQSLVVYLSALVIVVAPPVALVLS